MKKKIAHIVNLAVFPETTELHQIQPITIRTMETARRFSTGMVDVSLLSAQYPDEHKVVPESFIKTRDLDRSVLNIDSFQIPRKLPLIKDILDRVIEAVDADYIIYTNIDIGLLPNFYLSVNRLIDSGYDSFIITRRTISKSHTKVDDIPLMYSEVGHPHMGYDCFIFKTDVYGNFLLGSICLGAPHIGKAMLVNQILNSNNFRVFRDQHLTFHIGNDKIWLSRSLKDYEIHNRKEFNKIVIDLNARQQSRVNRFLASERWLGLRNKLKIFLRLE